MNKEIKKRIVTSVLATSILLSGCGMKRKNVDVSKQSSVNQEYSQTDASYVNTDDDTQLYIDSNGECILLNVLNDENYVNVCEDNKYTLYYNTIVYIKDGNRIIEELKFDRNQIVTLLEENSRYAKICFNDGTVGYVEKELLIKCPNLNKYNYEVVTEYKEKFAVELTYLYKSDGSYAGYIKRDTRCNAVATNGEYTLITLDNGKNAFVSSSSLVSVNKQINGYGIIIKDTVIYLDKELTMPFRYIYASDIVKVSFAQDGYACVLTDKNDEIGYIDINNLAKDYIIVDLDEQKMDCYLNYYLEGSWYTRTGKDATPTIPGFFDIDSKAKDWEFTTFPGSFANYWIPINKGQGIHDLIGDDEANYGDDAYKENGSHGCIRVPVSGSEFVYNNYHEGDMVLVRKK